MAHLVMDLPQGIGTTARLAGLAGERAAQDGLRHRVIAPAHHGHERLGRAFRRFLEVDGHTLGDDARCGMAEAGHGSQQGHLLFVRRAGRVLPEPDRQTVDFEHFRQVGVE